MSRRNRRNAEAITPTKEELDRLKLLLEIEQLKQPWWKKPTYVLAALPTVLALGTLMVGIFTGYFQATATKLENQRHDLEAEVQQFTSRKDELHRENDQLVKEREDLNLKIEDTRRQLEIMGMKMDNLYNKQDDFLRVLVAPDKDRSIKSSLSAIDRNY